MKILFISVSARGPYFKALLDVAEQHVRKGDEVSFLLQLNTLH